ncbi:MAG: hypothetical protein AB1758_23000 [Candidatus Eremiobacterota bacterium]
MKDATHKLWMLYAVGLGAGLYDRVGTQGLIEMGGLMAAMLLIVGILLGMLAAAAEVVQSVKCLLRAHRKPSPRMLPRRCEVPAWFAD